MKSYKDAGVDLEKNKKLKEDIKNYVRTTFNKNVLGDIGLFGGLFDASELKSMENPVLVASTDGVGTKLKIAKIANKWDTVGIDLVSHSVNDILVQGAKPIFFMDYIAGEKLEPQVTSQIVRGLAKACKEEGMVLLGGETAEMPGVYEKGEYDLAGTIVGVVEKGEIIDGSDIKEGNVLVGIPSSGLHTNGYSLARKVLGDDISKYSRELLEPHLSYAKKILPARKKFDIYGMAHLTGGGWEENIPRVLPKGLGVLIKKDSWTVPKIFITIQEKGQVSDEEMYRAFNMGIGMVVFVSKRESIDFAKEIGGKIIGEVVRGEGVAYA